MRWSRLCIVNLPMLHSLSPPHITVDIIIYTVHWRAFWKCPPPRQIKDIPLHRVCPLRLYMYSCIGQHDVILCATAPKIFETHAEDLWHDLQYTIYCSEMRSKHVPAAVSTQAGSPLHEVQPWSSCVPDPVEPRSCQLSSFGNKIGNKIWMHSVTNGQCWS